MKRSLYRIGIPALLVALLGVGLPVLAEREKDKAGMLDDDAAEMARLIEQGQLNLRDATQIAEKHVNGTALEANCELSPSIEPKPAMDEAKPGEVQDSIAKKLMYSVSCFAQDKLQDVRVDGQTKKVTGVIERKSFAKGN